MHINKKLTIRLSLVVFISLLILATAVTILGVSSGLYRNSLNWVIETLAQKVSAHIVDKISAIPNADENPEQVREALQDINISANDKILILDSQYRIIASKEKKNKMVLPSPYNDKNIAMETADDPILKKSFKKFLKNEKKKNRKILKRKFDHFPFWHQYKKYLAIYKNFRTESGQTWTMALIFPFSDFFGSITRNNIILYSITAFFVLLAIAVGLFMSRKISRPMTALSIEMDKIRNFDLEPLPHISSFLQEVDNMSYAVDNMRSGLRSFKKYVPSDLVRELIHLGKEATLGGERKNLTVYFSDIAGFTGISEKLQPEELVELLGEYLGEMTQIILDHRGTVDKYIGDAVMAFWGAPVDFSDHPHRCCMAALACQSRLAELGEKWRSMGKPDFMSRIGINTGDVIVGNMGYEKRMNYTVIGDSVNLASRLESLNKAYGTRIMLGENTHMAVQDDFETRYLDIVAVKGKEQGIRVYELMAEKGKIDPQQYENRAQYEQGLEHYLQRDFKTARNFFQKAKNARPDDLASDVFLSRCDEFLKNPPDQDWKGVYIAKSK